MNASPHDMLGCGLRPRLVDERGISLTEVMAAMVISLLIVAAGYTAVISTEKATQVNDLVAETQQNVRVAMELLARDVKMAGFGMTGPVGACTIGGNAAPIVPADNNPAGPDTGPDSVSMVLPTTNSDPSVGPVWTLLNQATGPFNLIALQPGAVQAMVDAGLAVGGTVSIGGAASSAVAAGGIDVGNDELTLTTQIGPPRVFPVGTQVHMLDCIAYAVSNNAVTCGGNAPCLLRDGVPIVDGVEDIQLSYACDGCNPAVNGGLADGNPDDQAGSPAGFEITDFVTNNTWALPPMTADSIRLVKIDIVARQAQDDLGLGEERGRAVVSPVAVVVSDHDHSADAGFNINAYEVQRRRVLTRTVETRNIGP